MKAIRLRTEYLANPLGMDIQQPRLFWNCQDGIKQTAWQIVSEQWDSGKVESSAMHADYPLPLADRERVTWKVRLWDENNVPGAWSEAAFFEMGITKWDASWITGNYSVNKKQRYPVDCFRKAFSAEKARKARLYITACGLYEAVLNGQRMGNFILAPGITDYNKRIQYQTYDVTDLLKAGDNVLTVQLADGWYRGSTGAWGLKNQYGTETALLCQLEITGEDGTIETVCSDETWDWSNDGPIRFADNKDGEIVDANRQPGYGAKAKCTSRTVIPSASNNVPVREHERFTPKLIHTPGEKNVLDFGQNIRRLCFLPGAGEAGAKDYPDPWGNAGQAGRIDPAEHPMQQQKDHHALAEDRIYLQGRTQRIQAPFLHFRLSVCAGGRRYRSQTRGL